MSRERLLESIVRFRSEVVATRPGAGGPSHWQLNGELSRQLLESMLLTRHLDMLAHELSHEGRGHYTICSAGHEANVVLGYLTRPTDPSMLHYRSAALQIERARQVLDVDTVTDIALSLVAAASEPLCSGRHKVLGSSVLGIIPQTSTIASHLPRAVGLAFALERQARLLGESGRPKDSIALVSFGDASLNHSTAQGALNAISWNVHQRLKLPLLLVCEDNQLGISVRTPADWVETRLKAQPHLSYFQANGWRLDETYQKAEAAIRYCRTTRLPAVLHLKVKRLLGHAGSDVDTKYRTREEISDAEAHDPVLRCAVDCVASDTLTSQDVLALDAEAQARVAAAGQSARASTGLASAIAVMAPLEPPQDAAPVTASESTVAADAPATLTSADCTPLSLAQGINLALRRILNRQPGALVFGEDVAKKGGVYGITKGLLETFGPARVFNTLLDEQTILGLALGSASLGMLPIPEIQYLAYLHNAEDQLRGEAATLRFFSNCAFDNPMIVRIAGLAYQKGFGGHFHNDNSLAVLRDIPGLIVGVPARADDATAMYQLAEQLTTDQRQVVVFIEPIALYHQRSLTEGPDADTDWLAAPGNSTASLSEVRIYHPEAADLLLVSYGNGVRMSLNARRTLEQRYGIRTRVIDLRWLQPLPLARLAEHVSEVGRALIVDECRAAGSVSEQLVSSLLELAPNARLARVTSLDSFVPLGKAADLVLLSTAQIVEAALKLGR